MESVGELDEYNNVRFFFVLFVLFGFGISSLGYVLEKFLGPEFFCSRLYIIFPLDIKFLL